MSAPAVDLCGSRFGQLFPWPGGKRRVAAEVWARLGDPGTYLEPFAGSAAVLFCRPGDRPGRYEHINDADGHVINAWRAVQQAPDALADRLALLMHDEVTVAAWGRVLVTQRDELKVLLASDPRVFDLDLAVAWLQGACCWLGWGWPSDRAQLLTRPNGIVAPSRRSDIRAWLAAFSARLAGVQVSCGDWSRVASDAFLSTSGITSGVFLDPPYRGTEAAYAEGAAVAAEVATWCRRYSDRRDVRVVLCGHEGDYDLPGWTLVPWTRHRGQGNEEARGDERLWCSPSCLAPSVQLELLGAP